MILQEKNGSARQGLELIVTPENRFCDDVQRRWVWRPGDEVFSNGGVFIAAAIAGHIKSDGVLYGKIGHQ